MDTALPYLFLCVLIVVTSGSYIRSDDNLPCRGSYYKEVSSHNEIFNLTLDSSKPELLKIATKSCFQSLQLDFSVNITYKLMIPQRRYIIATFISFRIEGNGVLDVICKRLQRDYRKMYRSHGSSTSSGITYYNCYELILIYTAEMWSPERDWLALEVYNAPRYLYGKACSQSWQSCEDVCLPQEWKCNGIMECTKTGADESDCPGCCRSYQSVSECRSATDCTCKHTRDNLYSDSSGCNGFQLRSNLSSLNGTVGNIHTHWPQFVPSNSTFTWDPLADSSELILSMYDVNLQPGDSITVYNDRNIYHISDRQKGIKKIKLAHGDAPYVVIKISSLLTHYNISYSIIYIKDTIKNASTCNNIYYKPCNYKNLCFLPSQQCNGYLDCPNGFDERGCGATSQHNYICAKNEIMCPPSSGKIRCFAMSDRCDGNNQCTTKYDELNCDSTLCGPHNGTFLCPDGECIFETWLCDNQRDCDDGADEANCDGISKQVITASVMGSLVCAIMIVIAAGCSCRLHAHRMYESMHSSSRYESPMTLIQNQFMRRQAPPPYAEAMQRSRPFDEVQSEYLASLEQQRANCEDAGDEELGEQQSIASSSHVLVDATEDSLVEMGRDNVSFRRNPGKPPDIVNNQVVSQSSLESPVALEPKSDEEDSVGIDAPHLAPSGDSNPRSQSRRQMLRRESVDSDVSLLSRESDDALLLG